MSPPKNSPTAGPSWDLLDALREKAENLRMMREDLAISIHEATEIQNTPPAHRTKRGHGVAAVWEQHQEKIEELLDYLTLGEAWFNDAADDFWEDFRKVM